MVPVYPGEVKRSRSIGMGFFVTMFTVYGSTISTRSISRFRPREGDFCSGLITRSTLNFTASALKSSPLWNFTPRRSLNCHVVSLRMRCDSASPGL